MVKIRVLQKNDKKELLKLAIEFFKKNQRGKIVSKKLLPLIKYKNYDKHVKEDVKKYMKLNPREAIIFVAEENEKLIGYIYGRILNRPKMIYNRVGIIEDWFVEEKYRNLKIGELLWNKLISWFKMEKCKCLELDVYPTNRKAIDIYHKLGFIDKSLILIKKL
jgi:ribosomal protein S18 acetylase RimI-like enzyme